METTSINIGPKIRLVREQQQLSLRELAKLSGLSINAISLIERGVNSPTISSLNQLAAALGVSITSFFEDEQEQAVVFVKPSTRLKSEANGIVLESLGLGLGHQQIEPFLITLAPGAGNFDQAVDHTGEEFVYCLQGEIEYRVGDRTYRLQAGSSLMFQARLSHCFHNVGQEEASMIMVFYAGASNHWCEPCTWLPLTEPHRQKLPDKLSRGYMSKQLSFLTNLLMVIIVYWLLTGCTTGSSRPYRSSLSQPGSLLQQLLRPRLCSRFFKGRPPIFVSHQKVSPGIPVKIKSRHQTVLKWFDFKQATPVRSPLPIAKIKRRQPSIM